MAEGITDSNELPVCMKVEDVAKFLGVSRATGFKLTREPGFPVVRIHRKRLVIPRDRFLKWLDEKADEPLASCK